MTQSLLIGAITLVIIAGGYIFINRANKPTTTQSGVATAGLQYVALGDSYTIGEGETEENRWPNQLVSQLKNKNIDLALVANPSRTGYTTQDLLNREISVLEKHNPAFVTIQIGVNDYFQGVSATEFTQRFKTTLDTVQRTAPNAKILIVTIPDYGKTPAGAQFGNANTIELGVLEYNKIIIEEAALRKLPVADVFTISQQSSLAGELVNDGLHPSGAQYLKWLQVITPEAEKILR